MTAKGRWLHLMRYISEIVKDFLDSQNEILLPCPQFLVHFTLFCSHKMNVHPIVAQSQSLGEGTSGISLR